ncbi:hypothetical protein [Campylobacter helveticus]|nr:hypothetical protein [Campylobacter helveticus]
MNLKAYNGLKMNDVYAAMVIVFSYSFTFAVVYLFLEYFFKGRK